MFSLVLSQTHLHHLLSLHHQSASWCYNYVSYHYPQASIPDGQADHFLYTVGVQPSETRFTFSAFSTHINPKWLTLQYLVWTIEGHGPCSVFQHKHPWCSVLWWECWLLLQRKLIWVLNKSNNFSCNILYKISLYYSKWFCIKYMENVKSSQGKVYEWCIRIIILL